MQDLDVAAPSHITIRDSCTLLRTCMLSALSVIRTQRLSPTVRSTATIVPDLLMPNDRGQMISVWNEGHASKPGEVQEKVTPRCRPTEFGQT